MAKVISSTFTNNLTDDCPADLRTCVRFSEAARAGFKTRSDVEKQLWAPNFEKLDKASDGVLELSSSTFDSAHNSVYDTVYYYKIASHGWRMIYTFLRSLKGKKVNSWAVLNDFIMAEKPAWVLASAKSVGTFVLDSDDLAQIDLIRMYAAKSAST